jgi:hypothetical protein
MGDCVGEQVVAGINLLMLCAKPVTRFGHGFFCPEINPGLYV